MTTTLLVQGMTCQGCVRAITAAIERAAPGAQVGVDLPSGRVTIAATASEARLRQAVLDAGYTLQDPVLQDDSVA